MHLAFAEQGIWSLASKMLCFRLSLPFSEAFPHREDGPCWFQHQWSQTLKVHTLLHKLVICDAIPALSIQSASPYLLHQLYVHHDWEPQVSAAEAEHGFRLIQCFGNPKSASALGPAIFVLVSQEGQLNYHRATI